MSWPLVRLGSAAGDRAVYAIDRATTAVTKHFMLKDITEYTVYDYVVLSPYHLRSLGVVQHALGLQMCGTSQPLLRHALSQKAPRRGAPPTTHHEPRARGPGHRGRGGGWGGPGVGGRAGCVGAFGCWLLSLVR